MTLSLSSAVLMWTVSCPTTGQYLATAPPPSTLSTRQDDPHTAQPQPLPQLAARLGLSKVWLKDESFRFDLKAFKVPPPLLLPSATQLPRPWVPATPWPGTWQARESGHSGDCHQVTHQDTPLPQV